MGDKQGSGDHDAGRADARRFQPFPEQARHKGDSARAGEAGRPLRCAMETVDRLAV